jgi:hypothetical protein
VKAALACVALTLGVVSAFGQEPGVVGPAEPFPRPPRDVSPRPAGEVEEKVIGPGAIAAEDAQFGHVVAIHYNYGGKRRYCSGTLLTDEFVLTAAHCGCAGVNDYQVDVRPDAREPLSPLAAGFLAAAPILFDTGPCRRNDLSGGRDLALLRLQKKMTFPDNARFKPTKFTPERLWDLVPQLPIGRRLTAVGYGYGPGGQIGVRMQGDIPIITPDCRQRRFAGICAPFAEMILAEATGPRGRTDTCGGDSGGPVFLMDGGLPRLIAVTSRAAPGVQDDPTRNCGGGGIYTLIGRNSVHAWLAANGVPIDTKNLPPDPSSGGPVRR